MVDMIVPFCCCCWGVIFCTPFFYYQLLLTVDTETNNSEVAELRTCKTTRANKKGDSAHLQNRDDTSVETKTKNWHIETKPTGTITTAGGEEKSLESGESNCEEKMK
jgi:hypothetical protein